MALALFALCMGIDLDRFMISSVGGERSWNTVNQTPLSELVDDLTAAQVRKLIDALSERAGAERSS